MLTNIPFSLISISLSESEKKVLIFVFFVLILLLLLFGTLKHLNDKLLKKEGKLLDKHITGYIKYGFVNDEKGFKTLAQNKNKNLLLIDMILPFIIFILSIGGFSIFCITTSTTWTYIFNIYNDMLIKFEVEMTTLFGLIPVWKNWPKITNDSLIFHSTPEAITAYILLICLIFSLFFYIAATHRYIAREKHIKENIKSIFQVKIENEIPLNQ